MATSETPESLSGADDDAEAEERPVCPFCDDHHIQRRTRSDDGKKWRCDGCGELFDDPDQREMETPGGPSYGPAKLLADPEITSFEEAREAQ